MSLLSPCPGHNESKQEIRGQRAEVGRTVNVYMHGTWWCRLGRTATVRGKQPEPLVHVSHRRAVFIACSNSWHTEEHVSISNTIWRRLAQISAIFLNSRHSWSFIFVQVRSLLCLYAYLCRHTCNAFVYIFETFVWGKVLLCGPGYLGPALLLSLVSTWALHAWL